MNCAFIFRRDLRIYDNTGLLHAGEECEKVYPIFILDPRQVENNPYKSEKAVHFMYNSLKDLDLQIKENGGEGLIIFHGIAEEVVRNLSSKIDYFYVNEDYSPFSIKRDQDIEAIANLKSYQDYLLSSKDIIPRSFTSFYLKVKDKVREPKEVKEINFGFLEGDINIGELKSENLRIKGGRKEGLELLERAKHVNFEKRDFPSLENYTYLSPHLKFGTISIREAYFAVNNESFRRELYWRDFYTLIGYHYDVFGKPFKREYSNINWENNKEYFELWKEGRTGYPIIDSGMRELNETGYINNRIRMLVSYFLVKVLFIDWRWGEMYFAQKLIDYDPLINNGNWQWIASTGTDYIFRVFDPWKQQKIYDQNAEYIKKWVKELRDYSAEEIHSLWKKGNIIDWRKRVNLVKQEYDRAKNKDNKLNN
ncbi:cryptochrome/photolyase family protein [Acidianus manzaensis]|uniref:Deoxyribodipyrimidine photolyase n=1 Tax=Acidianus manzaensis TaxID=282676 RepID=A0A1W6JZJ3_9CREN|nr:deoxyribodipyrimidine photo-lyase [Acidianus manzaensis]ARM75614.1 deoxyribodipyrimidine photolyase [Acidianus manzaensis]